VWGPSEDRVEFVVPILIGQTFDWPSWPVEGPGVDPRLTYTAYTHVLFQLVPAHNYTAWSRFPEHSQMLVQLSTAPERP
jgi:hypothetical protein